MDVLCESLYFSNRHHMYVKRRRNCKNKLLPFKVHCVCYCRGSVLRWLWKCIILTIMIIILLSMHIYVILLTRFHRRFYVNVCVLDKMNDFMTTTYLFITNDCKCSLLFRNVTAMNCSFCSSKVCQQKTCMRLYTYKIYSNTTFERMYKSSSRWRHLHQLLASHDAGPCFSNCKKLLLA